ncbi:acetyltransferase (GNAT) family protein [Tenacibaculum adriaticum]|uniref:Acetyltransferase (GNAT) family protein n=1 Tax=Tenacibaculum adriaticum TaxID=413713 RepID=A0A5S5DTC9_9FLAO|nr:GNAT family N-acetyltransferase [Tenacibaculum adriaticum]TYP99127.1 acetyltransferase (GNAT) family protein [Tenacibaculum adriaticum]
MKLKTYDAFNRITPLEIERVASFLFKHLEEYGDSKSAITKAINYAAKERTGLGGYVFTLEENDEIIAAVVINKTGMDEYIPENILVYIATHKDYRGKGLGKKIMQYTIDNCKGDIALHVEKDNPAKFLYEKLGFTNPYLEMRLKR